MIHLYVVVEALKPANFTAAGCAPFLFSSDAGIFSLRHGALDQVYRSEALLGTISMGELLCWLVGLSALLVLAFNLEAGPVFTED